VGKEKREGKTSKEGIINRERDILFKEPRRKRRRARVRG